MSDFQVGDVVEITGLLARADLNGRRGSLLVSKPNANGRYSVRLSPLDPDAEEGESINAKPVNLVKISEDDDDALMNWSVVGKKDGEETSGSLVVWPGRFMANKHRTTLMKFFKEQFGIVPTLVGCVMTLPDKDADGNDKPDSGGRPDFFFFVEKKDAMGKFAYDRFEHGMRWWNDIYYNNGEHIYPLDFRVPKKSPYLPRAFFGRESV